MASFTEVYVTVQSAVERLVFILKFSSYVSTKIEFYFDVCRVNVSFRKQIVL